MGMYDDRIRALNRRWDLEMPEGGGPQQTYWGARPGDLLYFVFSAWNQEPVAAVFLGVEDNYRPVSGLARKVHYLGPDGPTWSWATDVESARVLSVVPALMEGEEVTCG